MEESPSSYLRETDVMPLGIKISINRKIKAQRLRWATAWRRLHKKIKQTDLNKRQKKRALKVERAI